jgi:ferredoxin hydrogenase large subunit
MTRCARCANCWRICPQDAIEFQFLLENRWDEVKTLDLLHCRVCGEPLYSVAYGRSLTEKLEKTVPSLCPRHREELPKAARAYFMTERSPSKEA